MDELSRVDVVDRVGCDPGYVDRLVELGILQPGPGDAFSPSDVLRTRFMQTVERTGLPLDGIGQAVRDGALSLAFLDASAFDRFLSVRRSGSTFRELSDRTGIPLDLLSVIRESFGSAEPQPEDHVQEDEMAVVATVELMLSSGFRPVVVERWLRVCADSLRRLAETETDWWNTEVMMRWLDGGMAVPEMLDAQAELGSRMAPMSEQAVMAIYHGQQEHAWTRGWIEAAERALEQAGLMVRPDRVPAMCFLDITGYTRLTEEQGDEAAAKVAAELSALVRRSSREHGGQPVKWLGDGVMFHFPDPGEGVVAALEMVEGVQEHGLPPAHVGIHAGPVVYQEGDYYGRTVNVAARIAEYARPGEVLVTQEVVDAAGGAPVAFTEIGPVALKGLSESVHLHTARRAG